MFVIRPYWFNTNRIVDETLLLEKSISPSLIDSSTYYTESLLNLIYRLKLLSDENRSINMLKYDILGQLIIDQRFRANDRFVYYRFYRQDQIEVVSFMLVKRRQSTIWNIVKNVKGRRKVDVQPMLWDTGDTKQKCKNLRIFNIYINTRLSNDGMLNRYPVSEIFNLRFKQHVQVTSSEKFTLRPSTCQKYKNIAKWIPISTMELSPPFLWSQKNVELDEFVFKGISKLKNNFLLETTKNSPKPVDIQMAFAIFARSALSTIFETFLPNLEDPSVIGISGFKNRILKSIYHSEPEENNDIIFLFLHGKTCKNCQSRVVETMNEETFGLVAGYENGIVVAVQIDDSLLGTDGKGSGKICKL